MKYQTIIFDWSGTISDDRIPVYEANRIVFERYKIRIPQFEQFLSQTLGSFHAFARSLGINDDIETLSELYTKAYERIINDGMTPTLYRDANESLSMLKNNFMLAVLSSHPQRSLEKEAEQYEIKKYFTELRGDSREKSRGLHTLCIRLSANPQNTVYLGDMTQDIKAAKIAGLSSAAVCTGYHSREMLLQENPSLGVFNSLKEFSLSLQYL